MRRVSVECRWHGHGAAPPVDGVAGGLPVWRRMVAREGCESPGLTRVSGAPGRPQPSIVTACMRSPGASCWARRRPIDRGRVGRQDPGPRVGQALGANPFAHLVQYHRVLGTKGWRGRFSAPGGDA
ncbi:MAG: hypothetical protein DI563_09890 [Variovorax paradoxus]|uniref:Uncharacterized protein n=1 Tax=Variovorax paradoxus TaxID=34073 RepID=A0A2W5QDE2_VARPD|nr:MAG: hypothetical protein DI563_09890 [Variovorax paradoxus]